MNGEAREFLWWFTLGHITQCSVMDCVYWLVKINYLQFLNLINLIECIKGY
jgi:hypothetical protein